ncbi:MAG: hypothetical protein GY730_01600 [bacterium]|nr:hypothetical protein [bacterium]
MMKKEHLYIAADLKITKRNRFYLPLSDQGFIYGYGLFETILVSKNNPVLIEEHLDRLRKSAKQLNISLNFSNREIINCIKELLTYNKTCNCILNIYLSAGSKGAPLLLITTKALYQGINKPVRIALKKTTYPRNRLSAYKTLAYLPNVLEKNEMPEVDDIVLFNSEQEILESTRANIFFVNGQNIFTPDSKLILPGITRQFLLKNQTSLKINIIEKKIYLADIARFDEIFMTNSLRGIILIKNLKGFPALKSREAAVSLQKKYLFLINNLNS